MQLYNYNAIQGPPIIIVDKLTGKEEATGEVSNEVPWEYYPGMISSDYFNELLPIIEESCKAYHINVYGKIYESKRKTCIYTKPRQDEKYYHDNIPVHLKDDMPEKLAEIWTCVEGNFKIELDYVLVHIYRDHNDYLGWHNDKEALDSEIISVSLGATRRFQFRPIKDTKGYSHELALGNGDVVHMKGPDKNISPYEIMNKAQVPNKDSKYQILRDGCQRHYKHQIPQMTMNDMKNHLTESGCMLPSGRLTKGKLIKTMREEDMIPIRINLTFRQY